MAAKDRVMRFSGQKRDIPHISETEYSITKKGKETIAIINTISEYRLQLMKILGKAK